MSKIEVEIIALSHLRAALRKLAESATEAVQEAQAAIEEEMGRLRHAQQKRQAQLEICRNTYAVCRAQVDENGNVPPCTAEADAVRAAERALEEANMQISRFQDQASRYQASADSFHSTEQTIPAARDELAANIDTGLYYLRSRPEDISGLKRSDLHGSDYQWARRELIHQSRAGEMTNDVRGNPEVEGFFNSLHGDSRLRGPSGYDASHRVRGINIPENLTWQQHRVNVLHYFEARARNEPLSIG